MNPDIDTYVFSSFLVIFNNNATSTQARNLRLSLCEVRLQVYNSVIIVIIVIALTGPCFLKPMALIKSSTVDALNADTLKILSNFYDECVCAKEGLLFCSKTISRLSLLGLVLTQHFNPFSVDIFEAV